MDITNLKAYDVLEVFLDSQYGNVPGDWHRAQFIQHKGAGVVQVILADGMQTRKYVHVNHVREA